MIFFFQAEDGIRDGRVTGVQTCALPIYGILDSSGKPGDKDSINPSLDLIGLSVAFESLADNIVGNMPGNGFHQVYLRSLCLNLPIPATAGGAPPCGANARIAVSVDVQGNLATGGDSITPSAAALGAVVAFCVDRDESRFRR